MRRSNNANNQFPECNASISSAAQNCPKCGYPLNKKERLGDNIAPKANETTYIKPSFLDKFGLGIFSFLFFRIVESLLLFIPVVGWILGNFLY